MGCKVFTKELINCDACGCLEESISCSKCGIYISGGEAIWCVKPGEHLCEDCGDEEFGV